MLKKITAARSARKFPRNAFSVKIGLICSKSRAVFSYECTSTHSTHPHSLRVYLVHAARALSAILSPASRDPFHRRLRRRPFRRCPLQRRPIRRHLPRCRMLSPRGASAALSAAPCFHGPLSAAASSRWLGSARFARIGSDRIGSDRFGSGPACSARIGSTAGTTKLG